MISVTSEDGSSGLVLGAHARCSVPYLLLPVDARLPYLFFLWTLPSRRAPSAMAPSRRAAVCHNAPCRALARDLRRRSPNEAPPSCPHAAPPQLLVRGVPRRCTEETTIASLCACCSKEASMPTLAVLARCAVMAMVSSDGRRTSAEFFLHDATIEYFRCYFWSIFLHH
jgi:hypothetical protein